MTKLKHEFSFEELTINILDRQERGALFSGVATLTEDDESKDEFYVSRIVLDSGTVLKRNGSGFMGMPHLFADALFQLIANVIENDKSPLGKVAVAEWNDAVEDYRADLAA